MKPVWQFWDGAQRVSDARTVSLRQVTEYLCRLHAANGVKKEVKLYSDNLCHQSIIRY